MTFVADENVDVPIIQALRAAGHTVIHMSEVDPSVPDEVVLETANRDGALLVTGDTDFGELVFRQGKVSGGVILVRLAGLSARTKAAVVVSAITEHGQEMGGRFTVVGPGGVRIRRMTRP